jgi:signal transduction histidine kinase
MVSYKEIPSEVNPNSRYEISALTEGTAMNQTIDPIGQQENSVCVPSRKLVHDLNNLLNVIIGYSELLLDELEESNPLCEDLHSIHDAARRANDIASKL